MQTRAGQATEPLPRPHLQGYLLPAYHKFYWFGLNTSDGATWLQQDRTINTTYKSWGIFKHGSGNLPEREPNNYVDPEFCAGCNFTELITGKLPVWGWGDEQCQLTFPVMCRSIGEHASSDTPLGLGSGWHVPARLRRWLPVLGPRPRAQLVPVVRSVRRI